MCALLYLWILDQNLTTLASLSSDGKLWIHEKKAVWTVRFRENLISRIEKIKETWWERNFENGDLDTFCYFTNLAKIAKSQHVKVALECEDEYFSNIFNFDTGNLSCKIRRVY